MSSVEYLAQAGTAGFIVVAVLALMAGIARHVLPAMRGDRPKPEVRPAANSAAPMGSGEARTSQLEVKVDYLTRDVAELKAGQKEQAAELKKASESIARIEGLMRAEKTRREGQ